ncbi:hypothetical protein H3C61_00170 [Candidatus Gracilibacteria bacterium]|nr:hypothetical protein [Candidatus Gracilibacteria bacterium]
MEKINIIENNLELEKYNILVKDYLNYPNYIEANLVKDSIIAKITQELSLEETIYLKDYISSMAILESGKRKLRLYELIAGIYNNYPFFK